MGGGTNTHKPLEYVKKNMFTAQRGDRGDRPNVCIVITDGQSYEPSLTADAALAVKLLPTSPHYYLSSVNSVASNIASIYFIDNCASH